MAKSSQKLTFPGSQGPGLAARLDLPAAPPRAYALFAHCFTCSKDIFAAARIAGALAEEGFAVLRFDFTGLGASEGEFANTNFSSNVEDLIRAADYLRAEHQAPALLIGHSLGGAAVLAAAGRIPEVKAVATIAAPADADHVIQNFAAKVGDIERDGRAEVTLAGRPFHITKAFLDDVRGQTLTDQIAKLHRALLVFHSPIDQTVGIENASRIFLAAKHPKSFVSLDTADHLLTRHADAIFVAKVLSAWAGRYVEGTRPAAGLHAPGEPNVVTVAQTGFGKFQSEVVSGAHRLIADESEAAGGLDSGPSPYDFLSIALGTCTSMTLHLYAARKGLALKGLKVRVTHDKIHAEDCATCEQAPGTFIDRFRRTLELPAPIDETMRSKLLEIADKCPVHKTLSQRSLIETTLNPV